MKICKNCGARADDDSIFCDSCGQKFDEEFIFCDSCGEKNSPDAEFCEKCGHKLIKLQNSSSEKKSTPTKTVHNSKNERYFGNKRTKRSAKPLIFVLLALVVIGGGFHLFKNFSSPKKADNFICYVKDNELIYSDFSKNAPFKLANNLDKHPFWENMIFFSSDGKFILYGDNIEDNSSFSLYIKSTNFKKDDKEKIDSDVVSFFLVNNEKDVIYYKYGGGLYSYNISKAEKEKIDSDASDNYSVQENGRLLYITNDNRFYLKDFGKEKVKLASDVSEFRYQDENPDNILFSDYEHTLYEITPNGDKQKVASDVFSYSQNKDSSYFYFTGEYEADDNKLFYKPFGGESILIAKGASIEGTTFDSDGNALVFSRSNDDFYSKLIDDSQSSKQMEEPKAPEYPSYFEFDSDEAYEAASKKYEAEKQKYYNQIREYNNAQYAARNLEYAAEKVKDIIEKNVYDLYYFNGKESVKIATTFNSLYSLTDTSTGIISSPKENISEKVKLSSLVDLDEGDILNKIEEEATDYKFIYNGTSKPISGSFDTQNLISSVFAIGESDSTFYFVSENNDLYKIDATESEITPQLYDNDVSESTIVLNNGKDLFYVKDVDNKDHGDLFHNKEKIDSDVYAYSISLSANKNRLFYYKDFSSNSYTGELYYFENGKSQKVDGDVYSYAELSDKIYYLNDYSNKSMSGDLKVLEGKEPKLIDTDVSELIYPHNYTNYGTDIEY